jgi:hypothetical protein
VLHHPVLNQAECQQEESKRNKIKLNPFRKFKIVPCLPCVVPCFAGFVIMFAFLVVYRMSENTDFLAFCWFHFLFASCSQPGDHHGDQAKLERVPEATTRSDQSLFQHRQTSFIRERQGEQRYRGGLLQALKESRQPPANPSTERRLFFRSFINLVKNGIGLFCSFSPLNPTTATCFMFQSLSFTPVASAAFSSKREKVAIFTHSLCWLAPSFPFAYLPSCSLSVLLRLCRGEGSPFDHACSLPHSGANPPIPRSVL